MSPGTIRSLGTKGTHPLQGRRSTPTRRSSRGGLPFPRTPRFQVLSAVGLLGSGESVGAPGQVGTLGRTVGYRGITSEESCRSRAGGGIWAGKAGSSRGSRAGTRSLGSGPLVSHRPTCVQLVGFRYPGGYLLPTPSLRRDSSLCMKTGELYAAKIERQGKKIGGVGIFFKIVPKTVNPG